MMFGFVLVLAVRMLWQMSSYAVGGRGEGIHMDVYFYVECNMGPEANVHSAVRIS
jgi:hypothetical protein